MRSPKAKRVTKPGTYHGTVSSVERRADGGTVVTGHCAALTEPVVLQFGPKIPPPKKAYVGGPVQVQVRADGTCLIDFDDHMN